MIKDKKKQAQQPVKLASLGMDPRLQKMLGMFLKGPCKGLAVIVDDINADADIIDTDHIGDANVDLID
ncbi:MAG: hypothetical protein HAW67_07985, partial [Endozoicomonadaceae bacterium]|nr:hypothetical protein [Endozoicomonadaceae bacterium]